jgi:copper homeostasis protein
LSEGGITPSPGLISTVRESVGIEVFAIVRPRGGDFVYYEAELEVMRRDIASAKALALDGVALGVLKTDHTVDLKRTRELVELARPLQVTFHRGFDVCKDPARSLEDVIACGADRLLTAGGQADAIKGLRTIANLQHQGGGRIRIMAGGGIRIGNVRRIALATGVHEVHSSLRTRVKGTTCDGGADGNKLQAQFARFVVRESDVRAFNSALQAIALEIGAGPPVQ